MKKIIFLDIDGTLVTPNKPVSQKVKEAIVKTRENGNYVFLCTGRNRSSIDAFEDIGFDGYICSAGGYIEVDGKVIDKTYLENEEVKRIIDVLDANNILYNLEGSDYTYSSEKLKHYFAHALLGDNGSNSEYERLKEQQRKEYKMVDISEYDGSQGIHKLCFVAFGMDDVNKAKDILTNYHFVIHDVFSEHTINGEIIKRDINKGLAVKKVVEYLELDMEDTIGFGDSMNDYEMFKVCKYGVAMANASEELKRCANVVCESVDDDGVYHQLKRFSLF